MTINDIQTPSDFEASDLLFEEFLDLMNEMVRDPLPEDFADPVEIAA